MEALSFSDVDRTSPPERKVALFRSLFRGREDLYARLAEDVVQRLDRVLDTLLRALEARRG